MIVQSERTSEETKGRTIMFSHSVRLVLRSTGPMGIYTFRIKGALCHKVGSLLPSEGEQPKFAQIYITDSDPSQQIQRRLQHGHGHIDEGILQELQRHGGQRR